MTALWSRGVPVDRSDPTRMGCGVVSWVCNPARLQKSTGLGVCLCLEMVFFLTSPLSEADCRAIELLSKLPGYARKGFPGELGHCSFTGKAS